MPPIDEMLTIEPPPLRSMTGATACMPKNTPSWLISKMRRYVSSSVCCMDNARKTPALLTSPSIRSNPSAKACQSSADDTSSRWNRPPIRSATSRPAGSSTSATTTSAPSAAQSSASAAHCPLAAPVMTMTRSWRRYIRQSYVHSNGPAGTHCALRRLTQLSPPSSSTSPG